MKILALDLGNNLGVCSYDQKTLQYNYELQVLKGTHIFEDFCFIIGNLLDPLKVKLVVTATPVLMPGRSNILISQMKKYGALCALAWESGITVIDFKDSHAKKVVIGSGRADKNAIKRFYEVENIPIDSPDVRDARMFLDCYLQTI